jgi:hypothetical protein
MQFKETEIRTKKSHPRPGREGFTDPAVRDFINKTGAAGKL